MQQYPGRTVSSSRPTAAEDARGSSGSSVLSDWLDVDVCVRASSLLSARILSLTLIGMARETVCSLVPEESTETNHGQNNTRACVRQPMDNNHHSSDHRHHHHHQQQHRPFPTSNQTSTAQLTRRLNPNTQNIIQQPTQHTSTMICLSHPAQVHLGWEDRARRGGHVRAPQLRPVQPAPGPRGAPEGAAFPQPLRRGGRR